VERLDDVAAIQSAADLAGISERVMKLRHGWETILGKTFEEGQELSVGEWQRIALARAFFSNAEVLILDEPTASLDAKQEYELFRQFERLTQGKTTILISHRLSSARMADRILFIEAGQVVETGSHEELLAKGGRYADLFRRQATSYV